MIDFLCQWRECPIGALGIPVSGLAFRPQDARQSPGPELIACFRTSNIQQKLEEHDVLFIPRSLLKSERQLLQEGDILISTANSDNLVGKCVIAENLSYEATLGGFITAFRVNSSLVIPRFFYYWLSSPIIQARMRSLARRTTNIANLAMSDFVKVKIALPPLSEQQQIVEILQEAEEIRRLRAEAEAKTAELVPALFDEVFGDPVRNLLKWDVEPLASVINDTPKNGLYKPADLYGEGTPIIRIGDFTGGILRTSHNLQRVRIADDEIEQFGVCNGQILINRVNSIEHLGKSLLVASLSEPTVYESNMMRLDPKKEKVLPDFLITCLQHASIVAKLRAKAKKAINQASINQTDVLTLQIPVPPLKVQAVFALQVAHAEELRASGEYSLRTEQALSAALSAHAFSGQLTADWREAHKDNLTLEARERDAVLKESGALRSAPARLTMAEEVEELLQDRTDGIYSDLNREQYSLLREINRLVGGVSYARYFSAQQLSDYIPEGPLRRNPQAIEAHLKVFAVRGIILAVSRPRTDNVGPAFAACYRLPVLPQPRSQTGKDLEQKESDDIKALLMGMLRSLVGDVN